MSKTARADEVRREISLRIRRAMAQRSRFARNDGCSLLRGPEEVEFFLDASKVAVAGGEGSFANGSEGGSERWKVGRFAR
jgi:hypothetical protein